MVKTLLQVVHQASPQEFERVLVPVHALRAQWCRYLHPLQAHSSARFKPLLYISRAIKQVVVSVQLLWVPLAL
jgi:hypothetical protein